MQLLSLPHPLHHIERLFHPTQLPQTTFERVRFEEHTWRALTLALDELDGAQDKEPSRTTLAQGIALAMEHLEGFWAIHRRAPHHWIARALEGCPKAKQKLTLVRQLSLSFEQLGSARFSELVSMPELSQLSILRVDDDVLCIEAMQALSQHQLPARLQELHLNRADLSDKAIEALFSVRWPRLRALSLSGNRLHDAAIIALAERDHTPKLEELYLDDNDIADAGLLAIAYSRGLYRLGRLSLYGNDQITEVGAQALLRRIEGYFPALEQLECAGTQISAATRARFAAMMRDNRQRE